MAHHQHTGRVDDTGKTEARCLLRENQSVSMAHAALREHCAVLRLPLPLPASEDHSAIQTLVLNVNIQHKLV